jgi:predicted RNase H-like HicB family nuclease
VDRTSVQASGEVRSADSPGKTERRTASEDGEQAYCPDLPGVVATGDSIDECATEMGDAIAFHIEGLHDAGEPVPPSTSRGRTVEVAA